MCVCVVFFFFFQAEDGIRDLVRSRGLGDVYKRQPVRITILRMPRRFRASIVAVASGRIWSATPMTPYSDCLLYTSDAADERSRVDLGGRRIIKKKNKHINGAE